MKITAFSLVINSPDPMTGVVMSQHEKLKSVIATSQLVEDLGFDAYQIGERHGAPFLCSSPAVLLTAVAARTSRIRLLTGVVVLTIHDPLRVAEEFALLDHISGGRLDVVIAKGNHAPHYSTFGLDPAEQWDVLAEKYALLRQLWSEEGVTWSGKYRLPLDDVTTQPRTYQDKIRIWHGSSTSQQTTELAAKHGDPLFSANGYFPTARYLALIEHYRQRWEYYGHAEEPTVGVGFPALLIRDNSQEAVESFRPLWNAQRSTPASKHNGSPFSELEEFIEQGSALIGSPEQVLDKINRFAELYQHQLTTVSVDSLPRAWQREQYERFAAEIAPDLRKRYPDSLWEPAA